ncbi:MAG: hypothetical protein K9G67_11830 [Bacteroidales bacterium]|nr:hypothetical protein [Bacteroidales bacterium]MCF8351999.1 hypothetical protein [Bacteroidales bacterium]MCF8377038.1 hypothetical protein [Bacteroidales bacterium]MCF8400883.1 hypothetical protein [Bacteroidales bacterium]
MKTTLTKLTILILTVLTILACNNQNTKPKQSISEGGPLAGMFLSDFHIGENFGGVSRHIPTEWQMYYDSAEAFQNMYYHKKIGEMVQSIRETLEQNEQERIPYLILLGDIFDLAVHNESDAFNLVHEFFNAPVFYGRSLISFFDRVIYLPGNHDHHVWRMLQEEYYVENRLQNDLPALPFPQKSMSILRLGKPTTIQQIDSSLMAGGQYENIIAHILANNKKEVFISYPNLYIDYGAGNGICVTHGHFFEPNWNKDSSVVKYFPDVNNMPDYFKNLEKYNSPFTEFSDYAVAQTSQYFTDKLTDIPFEDVSTSKQYAEIGNYLAKEYPSFFPLDTVYEPLTDIEKLERHPTQVFTYLQKTAEQMQWQGMKFSKMVYGHTHVPCFGQIRKFNDFSPEKAGADPEWLEQEFVIYNTGGWVGIKKPENINIDNATKKAPNPMFLYEDGKIEKVLKY